jgi:hypothetical protein
MLDYQVIDDQITGIIGDKGFSVPFTKETYEQLQQLEEKLEQTLGADEYKEVLCEIEDFISVPFSTVIETACPYIKVDTATNNFYLHYNEVTSDIPMPKALVERIIASQEKGVDVMPLVKMWVRFLRNPLLRRKGKSFAKKFFNFVNIKYVHPKLKKELIEKGFSEDVATEKATMYQMKITKEGLLNGYKVSREILHKFDPETGEQVDRYKRTFNVDTGEIESNGLPDKVEERLFEPAVMGDRGDAFSCVGPNGYAKEGHFIKVGCVHALDSWDKVNTNDDQSCVPGLHVGGLKYIAGYSGEIHNVFIDPMHVGAIPDDGSGAIRCKQYFVHSSLAGVNGSIYHSSDYAKLTDGEWNTMLEEAVKQHMSSKEQSDRDIDLLKAL